MPLKSQYNLLARILVYCYAINAFSYTGADFDLWGHIKFGEDIWQSGSVPTTDPYNYTFPNHAWFNHEWLSEVLFYLLYKVFGSTGILIFKMGLGLTIIHLLSQLYFERSKNIPVYCFFFILWTHAVSMGFASRPHLITFLCLTVLLVILYRYSEGKRGAIWGVPPLMVLWVNCHGGFVAGFGIFGMFVLVESITRIREQGKPDPTLFYTLGISFLALLVNPYGYHLLTFLLETIPRERQVQEWWPIPLWSTQYIHFKILALLFVVCLFSPMRKRPWELAIVAFSIYYGFSHRRHSVLAAILLVPMVAACIAQWVESRTDSHNKRAWPHWVHVGVLVSMGLFAGFQLSHNYIKWQRHGFQIHVDPAINPVYSVRFLKENGLNGNILTTSNWGEYVIWKLPESKVSVDGRYWTVYPPDSIIQNMVFQNGWEGWKYYLDLYPHDIILTVLKNQALESHEGWVKIYQDDNSRIFVRRTDPPQPAHQRFIDRTLIYNRSPPSLAFP
jgi:hypothetical protein